MKQLKTLLALLIITFNFTLTAQETNNGAGTLLVVNRAGGSISLIDLQLKVEMARLPIGPVSPHELVTSPNGRWAVTGEYGTESRHGQHLVIIDVAAATITSRIDMGPNTRPHSIVFLSDNRHVIVTLQNTDEIALVDIINKEIVRTYPTGGREGHMVKLSKDESQAYVASRGDGTMSVIWLNENRPPRVISTGARAEGIAVSPDGEEIWVANQGDRTISIVNANTLEVTETLQAPPTNRIEFLPNGQAVIPGGTSADNSVRYIDFYDGESYEVTRKLELPASTAGGTGVRLLAGNNVLFLSDSALNEISVLDPDSGNPHELITINTDNVDGMAWSPLRLNILGD